jgi:signal transduction histidine kinase
MQVMLNLVLNAIAHAPQNSIVRVTATRRGDGVDIVVRDHGAGVPPADRERIFDAFYTTGAQGTGLGLSVVRHLARENEWMVQVQDAPGGGAEFKLSL